MGNLTSLDLKSKESLLDIWMVLQIRAARILAAAIQESGIQATA
jgi:hypothetical protein